MADGSADGIAAPAGRRLAVAPAAFESRGSVEDYLQRLNRESPVAERRISRWGEGAGAYLRLAAVAHPEAADSVFIGEAETSFALDVIAQARVPGAPYSVGLLLAGEMRVTTGGAEIAVRPGEGVIIDPAEVERTRFAAGSHFVEFSLPRSNLLRLGAELAPGSLDGAPRFMPWVDAALSQRLLFMATQAAQALHGGAPGAPVMFQRWTEMIALTLLHEQQTARPKAARPPAMPPAALRRALDFIDANAHADIVLADIAAAAGVSASSLLRLFTAHFGFSPGTFLRQVRLDRARAELKSGRAAPIREVAQRWGFANASKFSQAYWRRFGEWPRDARG